MTVETQDADLIRSQAPKMNMREVPVFYGSVATNTTLELRNGSILYGKSPTCQPTNKPVTIHCKAGCRSYSHSKQQEPNVRTLLPDIKMMVSPLQLTVPSVAPKQKSLSANPKHLKTGRSESNLRLCGECSPNSSKFSSLEEMMKVPSLSLHLMPVHKFSALRIEGFEGRALENQCDGRPFASPLFCGLPVEAPFSAVSRFDGLCTLRSLSLVAWLCKMLHVVHVDAHVMICHASASLPCCFRSQ